jgi:hypothetical protein
MSVDIAAENAITANRDSFGAMNTAGAGDLTVAGFARSISYNVGETVQLSVTGGATVIDIYRVGWYGGSGFRKVASIANTPTTQPAATVIPNSNGATTCTSWSVTATWTIPVDATSGIYMAAIRSIPPNAPNAFYATFVVRDDAAEADIIYKTSDATWGAAYNWHGGKNLYGSGGGLGAIQDRSLAVSYHRPVITRNGVVQTYWWACELPLIRWLERNGFKVKYVSSVDLDRNPAVLNKGRIFLSSGHDEYWSQGMRSAVENWRDSGPNHSLFMSGNEVFWKTRFQYVGDEAIMWCHKDTMPGPGSHTAGTPLDPVAWTGTWRDTRWAERRPEWFLTGTDFRMNGVVDADAVIPKNPYAGHKVWGGTSLNDGDIVLKRAIGFEADSMRPMQPAESVRVLAAYTRNINGGRADDNGQSYNGNGDLEWGVVSQRYSSGAVTVGFGTCQWSWTLDGTHDRGDGTEVSVNAQQFTMNLLRDLGAQPITPQSGLQLTTLPESSEATARPGP